MNGEKIGLIGNAETKEFEVEPGVYTLKTKIDWCGSETLTLNVSEKESKRFELKGFKMSKFVMPIVLLMSTFYFAFGEVFNLSPWFAIILVGPFFLYLVYHLTVGRNKYLKLVEK